MCQCCVFISKDVTISNRLQLTYLMWSLNLTSYGKHTFKNYEKVGIILNILTMDGVGLIDLLWIRRNSFIRVPNIACSKKIHYSFRSETNCAFCCVWTALSNRKNGSFVVVQMSRKTKSLRDIGSFGWLPLRWLHKIFKKVANFGILQIISSGTANNASA